jgi:hypothetical protein
MPSKKQQEAGSKQNQVQLCLQKTRNIRFFFNWQ